MIASYDIDEGGAFELIETLWNVNNTFALSESNVPSN